MKVALRLESSRQWHEVEQDFMEAEYRAVRDRQMKELEDEDDLMSKVPVRYVLRPLIGVLGADADDRTAFYSLGTCARNCTRNLTSSFGNSGYSVFCKVPGS